MAMALVPVVAALTIMAANPASAASARFSGSSGYAVAGFSASSVNLGDGIFEVTINSGAFTDNKKNDGWRPTLEAHYKDYIAGHPSRVTYWDGRDNGESTYMGGETLTVMRNSLSFILCSTKGATTKCTTLTQS